VAWLQQHGFCATGICISGRESCWYIAQLVLAVPNILGGSLTRLELGGEDTLLPLAPHLQQLPCLQHLRASISIRGLLFSRRHFCWDREDGERVAVLPDLRQLCPQLVSMYLKVDGGGGRKRVLSLDDRLPQLLPVGLQQLHLEAMHKSCPASYFMQLTALGHLVLDGMRVGHMAQLQGMSRLQQLEVWRVPLEDVDLAPLASKLVGIWDCTDHTYMGPAELLLLTRLTALSFHAHMDEEEPAGYLQGLASLRHLHMKLCNTEAFQGLSSLSSLRSLTITEDANDCDVLTCEQMELVAQATQLTSLHGQLWCSDAQALGRKTQALQQLTGLQRLGIDEGWFSVCGEAVTALQQLRQLVVMAGYVPDDGTPWEEVLAALQGCLPHLQQVLYLSSDGDEEESPFGLYGEALDQMVPSPLPGVPVMLGAGRTYYESPIMASIVRPRHTRPCPHLPGVLELLPQV
jgi:hypothetical protein